MPMLSGRRASSLTVRVVGAVALACVLLVGVDGWRTWQQRQAAIADDKTETENLARSLAQHAHDLVQTADTAVMGLRDAVETDGLTPHAQMRLDRVVKNEVASLPVLHGLFVYDATGAYMATSMPGAHDKLNNSDRPYFQYHRTHRERTAMIGSPVRSKVDGQWILTVSRRIDAADGSFAGVALATLSIEAIQAFYATFDVGAHGAIALETSDSVLVARKPADAARIGADLSHGTLATRFLPTGRIGSFEYVSGVDGQLRLGSFRHLEDYPLVVVVAHGMGDVLADWWWGALVHTATSLAAAAIVALMGWRLVVVLRLRQAEARRVGESERHYRLLATYSTDVISELGPDLRRVYVSPSCEAMLGYDPRELVGRHCTDMLSPEDQAVFAESLAVAREHGQSRPATYRVRRKDGVEIWVETIGRWMPDGQGFVMATRDVTERLQAEARLRDATARLRWMDGAARDVAAAMTAEG